MLDGLRLLKASHSWASFSRNSALSRAKLVATALAGLLLAAAAWGIHFKAQQDMASALAAYRAESALDTSEIARTVETKFEQIHGGLRTIGMLPSVRRIDRYGETLDQDALASIQQLYNNLASSVAYRKSMSFRRISIPNASIP